MKRTAMRILAMTLVVLTLLSCVASASAKTIEKFTFRTDTDGYCWETFYANTKDKKTAKLSFTNGAGLFVTKTGALKGLNGYWEIEIDGRNSTSESWKDYKTFNIKGKATDTIELKGYTQYRIKVYAWKTTTIGSNKGGACNHANARWVDMNTPMCIIKPKSNIKNLATLK